MERKCRLTVIGIWICLVLPLIVSEAKAQIRISKSSLTIEEGGKGSYKLHLDAPPSAEITLDITTTNSDVRVKPESLTFTPDDWGKAWKITVEAIRDADAEDDHAIISHSVRTASNSRRGSANLQPASATVPSSLTVIVLDRFVASHEVNISPSSGLSIRKGGSGNYSVSLIEKPDASVTVWASSDRSDVRVSPSSLTFYVGTWSSTRSFTVSVDADAASSSATISHSATSEDINYQGLTIDSLPVTVLQPPAGITQPPSRTKVLVGQTKTYYSPGLRSQPTDTVTINASSQAAGNATVTGSKSFGTGNWSTAQDFKVTGRSVGAATITYDVDSSDSRYDGYRLNSTSVTVEATTITCRADDVNIQLGGSSTLSWDSTNANSVTIDQGVGSVPVDSPQEGKTVTPLQPGAAETSKTTTYRFTAAGGGDPGTCSVTITVWRPPSVDSFSADLTTLRRQQTTRLSWATSHASSTTIDQGVGSVPVESSEEVRSVSPPQPSTAETSRSTSYTLTASNPGYAGADAASAAVSVTVWNRPSVDSFTASPSTIDEGEDSGLKWTTTHATGVSIDQGVGPVAVDDETGTTKVSPDQDTTYTLAASNPAYSGTHAVTDTVRVTVRRPTSSPGLSVSPTTLNITEGAAGKTYNVRLRTRPGHDVIVTVGIESGGDSRVQKNTSSLTFTTADWNRNQAVQVFAEEKSGTATGQARIANTPPSSYGGSAVDVTVNVADDDTDGCEATVMPTRLTIDEGENDGGYYDVVLAASPAASVTITLDLTGDPSLSADRSALTFTSGNWNTSQRVTIEAREDADYSDGRATIGHTASSTDEGCSGMSISSVSVNIRDDDEPPTLPRITLSSDEAGVSEPDGTAMVTAAVASGEEPAGDLTINLTHSGQATNGTDYTVATLTIGSGETSGNAELNVIDDKFAEGTEEIRLIANADSYRDSTPLSMNLTDDDSAGVTVTPTSLTIPEGGGLAYRVMLTSRPSHDVTVTVTHSGDRDIGIDDQELTFTDSDWETAQTVTVSAAQDDDARDDVATLSHSVASTDADYNGITVSEVEVTVTDDEMTGVSIAPAELTIAEGGSDSYEVVLTSKPSHEVTVTISRSGDTDIDRDPDRLTFSSSNWNTAQTVTVSTAQDGDGIDDAATLSHTVTSTDADYNGIGVSEVDVTVTDNEAAGVSIGPAQLTIAEGGSDSYEVVLTSQPSHDVTVTISRSGDGDVSIDDQELTFTASDWETAQVVTVSAAQDDDARDDTATLSHSVASTDEDYNGIGVSEVEVTATDDETAGVSILPEELTIAEGGSDSYRVVLTSQPAHDVTVTVIHSGDPDIGIDNRKLTFTDSDWETAQAVTVSAAQDDDARHDAATLSHTVTSTDTDYNGITASEVAVTVTDDEMAGVSILPEELAIAEGGSDTYQVVLTSQPTDEVIVTISRSGDGGISIDDQELTFTDSDWKTARVVRASAAHDDDARDDAATFSHTVSSTDADYNGITVSEVDVTVTDDETAGVTVTPAGLTIPEGGGLAYRVKLTSRPAHDVIIAVTHSGDQDIGIDDQELTFTDSDWNQAQTVAVTAAQDEDARDDTATLSHSVVSTDADYNGITVSEVEVTVTDDEIAGLSIRPTELAIAEGGSETYQVVLTSQPAHDVTVTITRSGDGDIGIDDQELTFTDSDWKTARVVRASAAHDDDARDDAATFSHTVSSTDADYNGIAVSEVDVTVTDDETAGVTVTPAGLTIPEGGGLAYRVKLTSRPAHDVIITITHSGDQDIGIDDQELTFTDSDWNQAQTVAVTAAQDEDARDDTATLNHSVASTDTDYNGITASEVAVTVTDDEMAGVSILPEELTIAEGGSDTYQVVLTSQPTDEVTVTITHSGDPDIGIDNRELTFTDSDWETAQAVTVSAAQDDNARDDVATLSHSVASTDTDYNGIGVSEVDVAVTDDETAGVSIRPTELTIAEGGSDTYQVVLTSQPTDDVIVTISRSGDGGISIDDQELTFTDSDWNQAQTVAVTAAHDDDAIDDNATFSHTVASADGDYNGITVSEVEVTATDDETAGVSITPTKLTIAEGGSDSYHVVLTSQPSHEVTVTITHSGDPDIGIDNRELTFTDSDWETAQAVTVSAAQDDNARDDVATLSHSVASTDGDYNGVTVSAVDVTVRDDETPGVSIRPEELTIAEGGSDSYEVVLTSKPSHEVTVTITRGGDADINSAPDRLTFSSSNWETAQAVTVSAAQDDDARHDAASLSHTVASTDTDYNRIGVSEVEVTVTDDETAGASIRPEELTIAEGASDSYEVVLTSQPSHEVTVTITHSGDRDISIGDQELTFTDSDWETAQTVTVSAAQDDDARDDVATLSHSVASADTDYNGIAVPEVAVTVTDDETAGVKVAPTRLAIPEDASTTYTVALTSRPSRPVVVALSHSGDPDISANVAQVSFEPSEWDNPSTVTVQASRDPDAVDDTATLRHSASSSDSTYDGAPVDPVRITVGDLDSVGVNITPLNLTIDEGASRTYTVVLTSKPSQDVVVEVDRSGDEDVVSQPDSLTFTGSNWQDPQAVTVQALQDPDAVDDTATLLHSTTSSDAAYGGLTVPGVSVSVIDDDTTGVNVSPLELAVLEGTSETCTVALASKPSAEVHISLNSNNNDVSPSPASLTFSPITWSTAQEVMVPVAQDEDATDEVATLTLAATSSDAAYHGIPVPYVSVDITDDDNAGVKVVPNPHMSVPEGESATYTIVLLSQPLATVAVAISSSNPQMLTAAFDKVTFTQDNWRVAQTVAFDTFHDDNTLDENEVLSHSAVSLDPNYKGISVTPLLVTITDRTAEKLTRTLPVLLSAMSGALAESIQTAVESRFERRRQMQRMKQDQGWWMPSYYQDRSRLSPEFNPSGGPETEPILSRASFGLPLAGNAFGGAHWRPVLWGHGDFQHFSGTSSLVDFRGRLSATHVGMDLLSNRHVLTGLSFARSWGAMGYSDDREGQLAASFNTFHPYLYWQPHRRLSLWGIGGMGRGSVDLRDPRLAHVFNSEFRMWAGGLRSVLTKPGKNELGFRLDGFMSNIAIDPVEQIREVFGRASRARAMLEAVHQRGGRKRSFSLKGEIGGRLDRGEAVHGAAMEAGLRLGFIDTPTGLDLSLQGRMLLFHDGGYRDWGAGLQASWDPGNKRRGLRMSAASSHGQNGRGGATLWDHSYAYAFGQGRGVPGNPVPLNRIGSEAAYSMEVLRGRGLLTPFSRLRWTGHGKELSVGSEFGLQPRSPDTNPLNMELEGIRGKSSRGPNMGVRIRMSIPF